MVDKVIHLLEDAKRYFDNAGMYAYRMTNIEIFTENCEKLPPNGRLSAFNFPNCVVVYKDEDYEHLFDVYHRVNGQIVEEHDSHGVHLNDLPAVVRKFLFDK